VDLKVTERHSNHIRDYYLGAVLSALSAEKQKSRFRLFLYYPF